MGDCITIHRAYKYRIYPNATQTAQLERVLDVAWRVYNDIAHMAWLEYQAGEKWNWMRISKYWLSERNRHSVITEHLPSSSVEGLVRRYDFNMKSFWALRKNGHADAMPPGEVKRNSFRSVGYRFQGLSHGVGIKLITNDTDVARLRLRSVPGLIRVHYHRPIPDSFDVKHCIVSKRGDKWFAVFQSEDKAFEPVVSDKPAIGIDVGMYSLLALSDGTLYENPRWYRQSLAKRRVLQRKADRQRRASNPDNYNENGTVKENAVIWRKSNHLRETERLLRGMDAKIQRQRQHYWHEVTDALTKTYGLIAIEDLTLDFMIANKHLAMSAHDASFATFWQLLEYKCEARGVELVRVKPAYTSQICSSCGEIVQKGLHVRVHRCSCGCELDRDVNAAINILNLALNGPFRGRHAGTESDGANVA